MKRLLTLILLLLPTAGLAQSLWSGNTDRVQIDQRLLDEVLAKSTRQFVLPVDGREYRVDVLDVAAPNLGVTSLRGRIDDRIESFFLLCRTETGATVAFFQPGDGTAYRLDHTEGHDAVHPVDYEKLGSCGGGLTGELVRSGGSAIPPGPVVPRAGAGGTRAVADDGSRHDILVVYTPAASEFMGGWDLIRAEAQLAVDAANLTYENSGIASELRLVHVMGTDYEEITAWDYEDHVEYLANPADGQIDTVLPIRNSVGADFVCMLIDGRNFAGDVPTCGIAYVMQPDDINYEFEYLAYSVVSVQCATDNWTLAHEVGHNRGCAHNREDASIDGAYSYAYGHRYEGTGGVGYRTVMAYDTQAGDFERVPYFSNPAVSFGGASTGVPVGLADEAHNALVHDNTAAVCATFRNERTFVEFGWGGTPSGLILAPYPSIIEAIWGSRENGTIAIFNDGLSFYGVLEDSRTYVHEGPGTTVLGSP